MQQVVHPHHPPDKSCKEPSSARRLEQFEKLKTLFEAPPLSEKMLHPVCGRGLWKVTDLPALRLILSCAALSSACRTSMLLLSFCISPSRWHISSRSTTMPSSTTLAISATAALDRASMMEAIRARRAALLSTMTGPGRTEGRADCTNRTEPI